jgi:hypothetical protein
MANVFTENVWILDTTGTVVPAASNQGGLERVRVRKLRWVDAAGGAVADNCQIRDNTGGNILWEDVVTAVGAGGEFSQETSFDGEGFELRPVVTGSGLHLTIDNGVLYVYIGGGRGTA